MNKHCTFVYLHIPQMCERESWVPVCMDMFVCVLACLCVHGRARARARVCVFV